MRAARRSAASSGGVPLSRLPCDARPADAAVAFDRRGTRTRAELAARVSALTAAIESAGPGRWLVLGDDAFAAAAALLALARCRSVAVLPPGRQPAALRRCAEGACGVVYSGAAAELAELPAGLARVDADSAAGAIGPEPEALDRDAPWIELHTSGTTGEPKRSLKLVRHLEDEVEALERLLGKQLPADARVFASVPHHHIYGLLFRLLWPLASGRPFQVDTPLHVREIAAPLADADPCALVTTPVHLRHLVAGGRLGAARDALRAVFSSAGPLDPATAERVAELLGEAPFEILGSTETGGVALRRRSSDGDWWSPLPDVAIRRTTDEGTLLVTSPFVSEGKTCAHGLRRFEMGDRVELGPEGRFQLLGRADRSVKIAGVRLSLPAMEAELVAHPWVREAALVARTRGSGERVMAALVLSEEGRAALDRQGRRACGRALAAHLAGGFDPVLLPRSWRYLDALPRNAQGKVPRQAVEALFEADDGDPRETRRLERRMTVPDDLPALEGHFPGHPIVPGVVQLGWVLDTARQLLGAEPRVWGMEALKFPTPLRPGDALELEIEVGPERDVLRFALRGGGRVFATGRCRLEAPLGEPA